MALPNVIGAYDTELKLFDQALDEEGGIRIFFDERHGDAMDAQLRLHKARSLVRDESRRIYEKTDPKWDTSPYDKLIVKTPRQDPDGKWWLYIQRRGIDPDRVEPLMANERI